MKNTIFKVLVLVLGMLTLMPSCNQKGNYSDVDEMVADALENVKSVNVQQLMGMIEEGEMILLVDVREPNEFNAGYIPGAVNIPRGTLEFKIGNEEFWDAAMLYMPEKKEKIIVYCKKGKRSILAAESLKLLGYKDVKYVEGGWKRWELSYPLIYEKNLDVLPHDDGGEVGGC